MLQQKPFILVVEDDGPLLKVLTRYLQAIGYTVLQATSFHEAVDRIAIKPNLVILDINLPDGTGWDVADWLQSLTQDVPIVMMSTSVRPSPKQLNKVGAKAFLAKPFPIEALLSLVKQYAPLPGDYLDDLSALA
jgi:two-component system, OmpR family, KDP operon response regulator KdpE